MDSIAIGLLVLLLAAGLLGLTAVLLRALARRSPFRSPPPPAALFPALPANHDAILVVRPGAAGGQVVFANALAREWFGLAGESLNIERLARRIRPSDLFLSLCAAEGQARFTLDGRITEGVSYAIPENDGGALLVALRRPQVTALAGGETQASDQALAIIAELSRAMASNLELEPALQAILESVGRLIPADYAEITVWEAATQTLLPYRLVGTPGIDQRIEKAPERYSLEKGYSAYLVSQRKPLLIAQVDAFRAARPAVDRKQFPFSAFLGAPLIVAGEPVGTLELASVAQNAFTDNDLEVLKILSGQAAIALHNALLFRAEQQRVREFTGLARLAHAAGSLRDSPELYSRLVESIQPLLAVEILGFVVYDEARRMLEAKAPFVGIPPTTLELYRVAIPPDSQAESVWLSGETIVAPQAAQDTRLEALGLQHIAIAAGVENTVLAPLTIGGRPIGYLQAADKLDGSGFEPNDLRLMEIIAGQSAAIIENALLMRQSVGRAQRAEALRRIASLSGSNATLDEVLQFSLRELARLLHAEFAAVFLVDETRGELRLHRNSLFGIEANDPSLQSIVPISDAQFRSAVTGTQRPFFSADVTLEESLPSVYNSMVVALRLRSIIGAPIVVRQRGVGEALFASRAPEAFDPSDVTLAVTTAGQIAAAIEKSALYTQTDERLRRRIEQLTSLTRISRELNTTLELERLLTLVYDELLRLTGANCGTILLFELEETPRPKVSLYIGDAPGPDLLPLEAAVLDRGESLLVRDYAQPTGSLADIHPQPPHAGVRCSLAVPIGFQEHIAGLIHLHSRTPMAFDETSIEIGQTLAIQAAIALGNARRYQEQRQRSELLNRRVETMARLLEATHALHIGQPLEEALETIAYGIQESTPFNTVVISVYDPASESLRHLSAAGLPLNELAALRQTPQPWAETQALLSEPFRLSRSYLIPADRRPAILADIHERQPSPNGAEQPGAERWQPDDRLWLPLWAAGDQPLGLIRLDDPRNRLRPDRPTIESAEIFAAQAGLAIESYQKIQTLSSLAAGFEREAQRAQQAAHESRAHLPALLHKDVEQTLAIQQVSLRARRVRAGIEMAESVNRQPNRSNALLVLGQEFLTRLEMDVALVAEPTPGGPRLLHSLGAIPANANPEALLGQRNPLRAALQTGELILAPDLADASEWQNAPLLQALEARAFICMPLSTEAGVDAAVLAASRVPLPAFDRDDQQLYTLFARQMSIALENLRLLSETNRRLQEVNLLLEFSRQLGSLDAAHILQTLVHSAMQVLPAAQTAMAALWDAETACLAPQVASGYSEPDSILPIFYRAGEGLAGLAFEQGQPIRRGEVDFARDYQLQPEALVHYRKATAGRLPLAALAIPIQTLENKRGVLLLENFRLPAAFSSDDETLMSSLAQQTALALENARLYQASEQRATQLRALTAVAATITSSLQTDALIATLLEHMKAILPYETGTLWLRQGNRLTVRAAHGFEDAEERVGLSVAVEDSALLREMVATSRPILAPDVRQDARFTTLIEARYLSWLGVPLLSKGEVVGVIALEKLEANFYTAEQVLAATTFAAQAAVALENANLFEESARRTAELDRRTQRLTLLNRLSTDLGGSLEADTILAVAVRELRQAIGCQTTAAFLLAESGSASLRVEDPALTADLPLHFANIPLFERLRETQGIFVTENTSAESDLSPLQEYLRRMGAVSLLALPLTAGERLTGVLFAGADRPMRFNPEEIELARTICNQVSTSLQNASLFAETQRLFAETQQRTAELSTLYEMGMHISEVLDPQRLMQLTFADLLRLTRADSVIIVMLETVDELTVYGIDQGQPLGPISRPRSGNSFSEYILTTSRPLLIEDMQRQREDLPVAGQNIGDPVRCWLGVPLVVRGATTGVISVQSYQPGVFTESHQRLLVQVASQLGIALENARLFTAAQSHATELEQRVSERTDQLAREHRRTQTLLSIMTELSTSLDLDLVLNRTLAVINDTIGAEQSLIMLVNPDESTLYLRASLGYSTPIPRGGQLSSLKPNEGLVGWVISHRQPALVPDLWQDNRWVRHEDNTTLHRSAMAVPLLMGEEVLGALLLFHRQSEKFSADQLDLVQATAKQIAVAINNAQLFRLIRDQAERLGDMLRTQHVETSRSQAILEAVADGVLVTDAANKITLFNVSAEQILGMARSQVVGRTLEHFIGLFGKAGQDWVQTIRAWTQDPASYHGEPYAAQITLENRRVVSVRLSPVTLRNDFLGTVSIFSDITHQVEVDRLKSEFVATVSHELRTPMTSIKGYVEILLMGAAGQLSEQQTHFLEVVKSNTERLAILVNDLLDVSRIEAGKVTLSLQPLDLREVALDVIANINRRMREENRMMNLDVLIHSELPRVTGDPERVRQILENLLTNAYQYTPENGRIELRMSRIGGEVQIDVQDNGIGIPAEEQPRIFERFYRGEDPLVLASSGAGLGLSIVQRLVEMHNGRIWLTSAGVRGQGSTFSVTLPVYE